MIFNKQKRGFTVFFAVLVSSLALAVGLAIYDLLIRELNLSQTATQSQYAIYAADTGIECAFYWDLNCPTSGGPAYCARSGGSAFATSSTSNPPVSGIYCALQSNGQSQDIAAAGTPPATFTVPPTGWTTWVWNNPVPTATAATTTFWVLLGTTASSPCAKVTVSKTGNPSATSIVSRGYNSCSGTGIIRLERALQANY
ncbi:MAG TPA: hypothetical protein VD928_01765 [Candidatus Paceibacterota bacterium]|nr:hypothetical protein [Candidatus Paceibacterota bacterium]